MFESLKAHVEMQLRNILCIEIDTSSYLDNAIKRTIFANSFNNNKYYRIENSLPKIFHSGQYCVFLYYLSNEMYLQDNSGENAEKVYYLNKILNSVDIFYEVTMPDIFSLEHPLGSVMGRAKYGDYFHFYQGCTVGGSNGLYPLLGKGIVMYSNSKILGDCHVGNNVIMSANSYIIDCNIPDNSIVFGQGREMVIKQISTEKYQELTKQFWSKD